MQRLHRRLCHSDAYRASDTKPQRLLSGMGDDVLLCTLPYTGSKTSLALAAASPRARFFAEMRRTLPGASHHVAFRNTAVVHQIISDPGEEPRLPRLPHTAWWIEKCGLPLLLLGDEKACRVLATSALRRRLRGVTLTDPAPSYQLPADMAVQLTQAELSGEALVSVLGASEELRELQELTVTSCTVATYAALCQMPNITALELWTRPRVTTPDAVDGPAQLTELGVSHMACAPRLERIRCLGPSLATLSDLERCESLVLLSLADCPRISSVAALSAAVALRTVSLSWCGLRDLAGLADCVSLEFLHLDCCKVLESLSALAGAPQLRELSVFCSGVRDVSGLAACPRLESVNMTACRLLEDLSPLAGAPRLRRLDASFSAVRSLDGLGTCARLEVVRLDACSDVTDLHPLAEAPCLKYVSLREVPRAALTYPPRLAPLLRPAASSEAP